MKHLAISTLASLALTGVLLLTAPAAHADTVTLTLLNSYQDAIPGDTVSFDATVSAPSTNTGAEYLNGDSFSTSLPLDDSGYFNTFPLTLNPGDSYTGLLFTILVPYDTLEFNVYSGSFTVTGGADTLALDNLSSVSFDVNVTPEPPAFILLATGILAIGFGAFLRKRGTLSQVAG